MKPSYRGNSLGSSVRMFEKVLSEIKNRKGPEFASLIVLKENPNLNTIARSVERHGFTEDRVFLKDQYVFFVAKARETKN